MRKRRNNKTKRNGTGHWLPHSACQWSVSVCARVCVCEWRKTGYRWNVYDEGMREALQAAVRNVLSCTTRNTTAAAAAAHTRPIADCVQWGVSAGESRTNNWAISISMFHLLLLLFFVVLSLVSLLLCSLVLGGYTMIIIIFVTRRGYVCVCECIFGSLNVYGCLCLRLECI